MTDDWVEPEIRPGVIQGYLVLHGYRLQHRTLILDHKDAIGLVDPNENWVVYPLTVPEQYSK